MSHTAAAAAPDSLSTRIADVFAAGGALATSVPGSFQLPEEERSDRAVVIGHRGGESALGDDSAVKGEENEGRVLPPEIDPRDHRH